MKLSVTFPELREQRVRIGAIESDWIIGSNSLSPREQLLIDLGDGVEIELDDIEVGPGGLLVFKGEQVLLYIKDTRSSLWELQNEPEKSRRFHVAECRTLERMRIEGRFERYVVTNRMDGLFSVDWLDPDTHARGETEAALKVCKNCLSALNWRGYERSIDRMQGDAERSQTKSQIWRNFAIDEFLREFSTFFSSKPSRRDTEAGLNQYVKDWARISELRRREVHWCCEKCGVDLSSHPNLLHCHHRNGVVTDNERTNLEVLCALCHAEQPGHNHMKVPPQHRAIINAARANY